MHKNTNILTLAKQFILLICASFVLPNLMAAPTTLTFDVHHESLSKDNAIYRLQNHTFEPSNVWTIRVEEGFLVKDTEMTNSWNQVGGQGKFHASINQDPSVSRSVLISSALRVKAANDSDFRFCQMHLSAEKTMKKQVIVEISYLGSVNRLVDGVNKLVKEWGSQKVNLSEGGSFVELNLSSKNVYEVLVHAVDTHGTPVMIVIDQVVLHHKNGSCS
jgi:hypothetical protein